jgi:hypothetical protein
LFFKEILTIEEGFKDILCTCGMLHFISECIDLFPLVSDLFDSEGHLEEIALIALPSEFRDVASTQLINGASFLATLMTEICH